MKHILLEFMPPHEELEADTIYISLRFGCSIHKCPCGCGEHSTLSIKTAEGIESPDGSVKWSDGWDMKIENNLVSFSPSILNLFACNSHYFIKNSQIEWA